MATLVQTDNEQLTIGSHGSATLYYRVDGATSAADAAQTALDGVPATFNSLWLADITVERLGETGSYSAQARYSAIEPRRAEEGFIRRELEGTTEEEHISHSLETVSQNVPAGETATDYRQAINVDDEGIQGIRIPAPRILYSETHYTPDTEVDDARRNAIAAAVATVNSASFRGWAAGELLMVGCRASRVSPDVWEEQYRFQARPNRSDITIGGITVSEKRGWDVMWIRSVEYIDDNGVPLPVPLQINVERVFEYQDWSITLGL